MTENNQLNLENQKPVEVEISVNPEQLTKKQRRAFKKQNQQAEAVKKEQCQKRKSLLIWIAVFVGLCLIVWGVIFLSNNSDNNVTINSSSISEQDHIYGSAEAEVVIIEYSDFQCPACRSYYSIIKQLEENYSDQLAVVYRNYPLSSLHPNAVPAAEAAEAASLQGKFWEMYDKLFANQVDWSNLTSSKLEDVFVDYAEEIGLDTNKFKIDLDSNTVRDKVQADTQLARAAGLNSTPTFFINGQKINNPRGLEEFEFIINKMLDATN